MEQPEVHALTAAYALDALDEAEEREYEAHLRTCERCREELAAFTDTASALAYAVDTPPPPPGLRDRIVEAVQAERAVVVPFRPRRRLTWGLGAVAAAAAVLAVAFGLWASSLNGRLDRAEQANAILGDPNARSTDLTGADGRVVVSPEGDAVLVVSGLDTAPSGKDYQAWVIEDDQSPRSAGVFDGGGDADLVTLQERVPPGAVVAVTLERNGGVKAPTQTPLFSARA
jgi:anti-sigma-K factor RskA